MIRLLLFSGIIIIGLSACGKKDDTDPILNLNSPNSSISLVAGTVININGEVSDDKGLQQLLIELKSEDGTQILQADIHELEGLNQIFSHSFTVGDIFTESGIYTLRIRASDAAGNFDTEFVQVDLTEVARRHHGVFLISDPGTGDEMWLIDSSNVISGPFAVDDGVSCIQADNYDQLVFVGSAATGRLRGYETESPQTIAFDASELAGSNEGVLDVHVERYQKYAALGLTPFIKAYNSLGTVLTTYSVAQYSASSITANEKRVFAGQNGIGISPRLDAFNRTSGAYVASAPTGWVVSELGAISQDRVVAMGNLNGEGRIVVAAEHDLSIQSSEDLNDTILDADIWEDRSYILTNSGLYVLEHFPVSISTNLYPGSYSTIGFEPAESVVYLFGDGKIDVVTTSGSFIRTINGGFGKAEHVTFWANKP